MSDGDRYRLGRQLGSGGMGTVYEATRVSDDGVLAKCAVKLLNPDMLSPSDREQLSDEAQLTTALSSTRIVKVYGTTTIDNKPAIDMEWVDGVALRELVDRAKRKGFEHLGLTVSCFIVGEVLEALRVAHNFELAGREAGVIHHDVSPGNILISSDGEVKLTDFGISKVAALSKTTQRASGTPGYMAPELLHGHPCLASDIYSLGVVLHEMLDGARYWGHLDRKARAMRLIGGDPAPLSVEVPAWVDELRLSMLAKNPDDRPTAAGAQDALFTHVPDYARGPSLLRALYTKVCGQKRSGLTGMVPTSLPADSVPSPRQIRTLALAELAEDGAPRAFMRPAKRIEDASVGPTGSMGAVLPATASGPADVTPPPTVPDGPVPEAAPPPLAEPPPQLGVDDEDFPRTVQLPPPEPEPPVAAPHTGVAAIATSIVPPTEEPPPQTQQLAPSLAAHPGPSAPMASPQLAARATPAPVAPSPAPAAPLEPQAAPALAAPSARPPSAPELGLPPADPPTTGPNRRLIIALVVVGAALLIAVAAISVVLGRTRDDAPEKPAAVVAADPRPVQTDSAATEPPADEPPAEFEEPPLAPPLDDDPVEIDATPPDLPVAEEAPPVEPIPDEVVEAVDPTPADKPKPKAKPKVEVTFQFVGVRDPVELRVGSKRLLVTHFKTHKLAPGKYAIKWRLEDGGDWHSLGKLTVKSMGEGGYIVAKLSASSMTVEEHGS